MLKIAIALIGVGLIVWRFADVYTRRRRVQALWERGVKAYETRNLEEAYTLFARTVKLVPTAAVFRRMLGRTLMDLERLEEAEQHLRLAADLEPRNPDGHLDLAFFLASRAPDRPDEAIDSLTRAVECSPEVRRALAEPGPFASLRQHPRFQALLHE